jgi:hypothetical protein
MARYGRTRRGSGLRIAAAVVAALALSATAGLTTRGVFAAGLTVNGSIVYDKQHTITPRTEMKPSACSGVTITQVRDVAGGSTFGTSTSGQLWLGNAGQGTTINAGKNGDCIVPGAVADGVGTDLTLNGGSGGGTDVCYNGPGPGTYARTACTSTPSFPYGTVVTSSPTFS